MNNQYMITPKWAVGENLTKLLDSELHPKNGRYLHIYINTRELIDNSDFIEVNMNSLFTGNDLNDSRISRILKYWNNNKFIDPPTISFSHQEKLFIFLDGRHRAKLSYFLNFEMIPVAIDTIDFDIDILKLFTHSYI